MRRFWARSRQMLWARGAAERAATREIEAHLRLMAKDLENQGLSASQARRQAAMALGGVEQTRELHRAARGFAALENLERDVRHAGRGLRRAWTFTLAAVLTLGLGLGATTAIYSVVQSVLLDPLHYPQPERLASLRLEAPGNAMAAVAGALRWSESLYLTASEHNHSFAAMGIWIPDSSVVSSPGAEPAQVRTLIITDGVLQALGAPPALGRWLNATDQTPNGDGAVMLSYPFWQQRFGGAAGVVGRKLLVDNRPRVIAGVMPRGFRLAGADFDLLIPDAIVPNKLHLAGFEFNALGRLRPGVTLDQADRDMRQLIALWMDSWTNGAGSDPHFYLRWRITPAFEPLQHAVVGGMAPALWAVFGTTLLVLLMACVNVMNLFMARAESRRQELAVRSALGAGAADILRAVLAEGLWLALAGAALGWAVADGALRLLAVLVPAGMARLGEVRLDARSAGMCVGLAVVCALACGMAPLWQVARQGGGLAVFGTGRSGTATRQQRRRRDVLVAAQVGLALVLLFGAGLLLRSFAALRAVQLGFQRPVTLQTFGLLVRRGLISDPQTLLAQEHAIADRIAAVPGVRGVSFASDIPMLGEGHNWDELLVDGKDLMPSGALPMRLYFTVAPEYFRTMGIPLLAGRDMSWTDIERQRPVVVVSAALAQEEWGGPAAAIGKRVREETKQPWFEVIGVAGDVRNDGPYKAAAPAVYWPLEANDNGLGLPYALYVVRSDRAGSQAMVAALGQAVHAVNANLPLAKPRTMAEVAARSQAVAAFAMVMLGLAGGMALMLGVIGVYGVIAYDVTRRRREISIRLALGAERREVQGMFVKHALRVAGVGAVVGGLFAVPLTASLRSLLFGVRPFDVVTLLGVVVVLGAAVTLAAFIPAWRGAAVPPAEALAE